MMRFVLMMVAVIAAAGCESAYGTGFAQFNGGCAAAPAGGGGAVFSFTAPQAFAAHPAAVRQRVVVRQPVVQRQVVVRQNVAHPQAVVVPRRTPVRNLLFGPRVAIGF